MAEIRVTAERDIPAPPQKLYGYIADYDQHHPRFLPPAFSNLHVESGGIGEGTIISFRLKSGGRQRDYRMRIEEPQPGRVLTESDTASSLVTRWTVAPLDKGSRVRIETTWQGAGGVGGFFERTFAPRVLRNLYTDELARLEGYAAADASA